MNGPFQKMKRGGIASKWLYVTFLPTLAAVTLACLAVLFVSRQNYYYSAEQAVGFRVRSTVARLPSSSLSERDRYEALVGMVEDFSEKDRFEFMLLDRHGDVLVTSSGFAYDAAGVLPDFSGAQTDGDGRSSYIGALSTGEHIIAVTQLLDGSYGDAAAVRFVSSLRGIDTQLARIFRLTLAAAAIILALVSLTGSFFVRSMVQPLGEIGATAKKIAAGGLDVRIEGAYSGEIGELCGIINEMASELERSDKVKNDFVSSISHELRTPLTSIKGWGETISAASDDEELRRKGLDIILSETDRLSSMVEDLLDFSRLEAASGLKIEPTRLDLVAELSDAVLTVEQRARKQGIEVKFSAPEEPVVVNADKNRLKQVFTNIFDNAIKYSARRKTITVRLELEGGSAVVSVRDRGPGIPKDELDKVVQRYYRASNSVYGTGIGLALVNEIVKAHGGQLLIDSALGHGTTVSVVLPLAAAAPPDAT